VQQRGLAMKAFVKSSDSSQPIQTRKQTSQNPLHLGFTKAVEQTQNMPGIKVEYHKK